MSIYVSMIHCYYINVFYFKFYFVRTFLFGKAVVEQYNMRLLNSIIIDIIDILW